jgi:hypothetical protein
VTLERSTLFDWRSVPLGPPPQLELSTSFPDLGAQEISRVRPAQTGSAHDAQAQKKRETWIVV